MKNVEFKKIIILSLIPFIGWSIVYFFCFKKFIGMNKKERCIFLFFYFFAGFVLFLILGVLPHYIENDILVLIYLWSYISLEIYSLMLIFSLWIIYKIMLKPKHKNIVMKGLSINFKRTSNNILKALLQSIDFTTYDFDLIKLNNYNTNDYTKDILLKEDNINIEFLKLLIKPLDLRKSDINNYKEFINSDYVMSIIINNYGNIEIWSKDEEWLNQINISIIKNMEYLDIKYKNLYKINSKNIQFEYK